MKPFNGVYRIKGKLATLNSSPGFRVYDEKLIQKEGNEYRLWDPYRSKLSAAILRGLDESPFDENSNVLYLGASSGTTASHIADICSKGVVYCVEFSKRMMRELLPVTMRKRNMIPILADAAHPREYIHRISSVDVIYQDVAQPNQAEILIRNSESFSPVYAMLAIKSRSIDTTKSPKKVFREETEKLKDRFDILQAIDLRPYDRDHVFLNLKFRG
jgi:fibrillarin-like pre-rRNA processing protein